MTLYILRHGETEFNRLGIVQGSGVDSDLNETGRAQAKAFYEAYQHIDFELIITSKLKRTHQTVAGFLEHKTPWLQDADINEICWGEHEGLTPNKVRLTQFQNMLQAWINGNLDARVPGGESANQLAERLQRFIEKLKKRPEKRILIATHGRTMRCLVTLLKGIGQTEMETVPHVNTGCYVAHYQDGTFVFELENDVSHLDGMLIG